MAKAKLSEQEIAAALASLTGWSVVSAKLHREYKFPDFVHAFGFMATCATAIEAMTHHPEWFNVCGKVTVDPRPHSGGAITIRSAGRARLRKVFFLILGGGPFYWRVRGTRRGP